MLHLWRNSAQRINIKLLYISKNCYTLLTVDPLTFPTETLVTPDIAIAFWFLRHTWSHLIFTKSIWALKHRKTSDLPKVTQVDSGEARIWTQAKCLQKPHLTVITLSQSEEWSHVISIHGIVHNLGCLSLGWHTTCHISCQPMSEGSMKQFYIFAGQFPSARKWCWEYGY